MARFTIVLPFAGYNGDVRESLEALARLGNPGEFEILLVWNNPAPMDYDVESEIRGIMNGASLSFRILPYPDKQGPSQAWCFGLREAATDYICFLAVDAPVAPGWGEAVASSVDGAEDMYQGDFSASAHDDVCGRLDSAIDRVRFENLGNVDFRNFIIRRRAGIEILDGYFRGLFFSDVELEILRRRLPRGTVKKIPGARVINFYPRTLRACARRKFRHGINVGHILRHFPTVEVRAEIGAAERRGDRESRKTHSNIRFIRKTLSSTEGFSAKLALAAMHAIFFSAAVLGLFLPGSLTRRFYIMHFEDQDNARKISAG